MEIKEIQDEIIEEFSLFEDWMQKYEYMIELGGPITKNKPKEGIDPSIQAKLNVKSISEQLISNKLKF